MESKQVLPPIINMAIAIATAISTNTTMAMAMGTGKRQVLKD